MSKSSRIQILIEIALFAALAMVLDFFSISIGFGPKISIKMLPIIILALRRGTIPGIASGLLWGTLQIILGDADILSPLQAFIEYFLAFSLIGVAGVFHSSMQKLLSEEPFAKTKEILVSISSLFIGSFLRYIMHFIAGVVFWGSYARESQGPVLYSFLTNGSAFLSEFLIAAIVLVILSPFYKTLLRIK